MDTYEDLLAVADRLDQEGEMPFEEQQLDKVRDEALKVGRGFSGSWWGYHSRVYFKDLQPAPPGVHFSQEFGLMGSFDMEPDDDWSEFDHEEVLREIDRRAGDVDLSRFQSAAKRAAANFDSAKSNILSLISTDVVGEDEYLAGLREKLANLKTMSITQIASNWAPNGQIITQDSIIIGQGIQVPPHFNKLAVINYIKNSFTLCKKAAEIARQAGSHIERKNRRIARSARIGTNIFIGHGRSFAWRDLKDFLKDRLNLPYDEFNRVPVAGITNIARLSEMLDSAAFAFVIMTAEDEMAGGELQARMNVIHEVGLFQGRLGFTKAIVLVEDGCSEFSNIQGLGQIRFPTGKISAVFEQIREVLEREGVISS